jgi:hypothetical protein
MQQSDKHGPIQDEFLKHETEGLERAGRSTHAEEWAEPEPAGDISVARPMAPGVPPGMTPREVEERSLLARYLGPAAFPGSKSELVAKLRENHAPDRFISRIDGLPANKMFANVREVAEGLGLHVEAHRS